MDSVFGQDFDDGQYDKERVTPYKHWFDVLQEWRIHFTPFDLRPICMGGLVWSILESSVPVD